MSLRSLFRYLIIIALGLFALMPSHAWATTYTVTDFADSATDTGSLRYAVSNAQSGDTIVFQPGLSGTIILNSTLDITNSITIQGPGVKAIAVSGNNADAVFAISGGTSAQPVAISGLAIVDGNTRYNGNMNGNGEGGGVYISPGATLTLANCTLTDNSAGSGGGLFNSGKAILSDCTIDANEADGCGGVYNSLGTMTLTNCTISGNTAGRTCGGLLNLEGNLTVSSCTIAVNYCITGIGGIDNGGAATVTNSVIIANSVFGGEGALSNTGTAAVTNCTFTGNSARGGGSAVLYNNGTLTLTNDILYEDIGGEVSVDGGVTTASNCDIGEALGANGDGISDSGNNLDANPLFVTPQNTNTAVFDLRLQNGSPCLGTGATEAEAPTGIIVPPADITGAARPSPPSIGAYDATATAPSAGKPTTLTLTSSANPLNGGQSVVYTATISAISGAGTPTGTVTFTFDGVVYSVAPLIGNQVTCDVYTPTYGNHIVTANYSGDSDYTASMSSLIQSVPAITLHTFSPGLQMISVTEDYSNFRTLSGVYLAWDAPTPQPVDYWIDSSYFTGGLLPPLGEGAWAYFSSSVDVYEGGTPANTTVPFSILLNAGWNLIGDPFPDATPVSSLSVSGSSGITHSLTQADGEALVYGTLYTYPAGASAYRSLGLNDSLQPFAGYWLYAFQPCTLLVSDPATPQRR